MRIAQVAPLQEAVPPRFYGGTERVVSYLTENLVQLGHDGSRAVIPRRALAWSLSASRRCVSIRTVRIPCPTKSWLWRPPSRRRTTST